MWVEEVGLALECVVPKDIPMETLCICVSEKQTIFLCNRGHYKLWRGDTFYQEREEQKAGFEALRDAST